MENDGKYEYRAMYAIETWDLSFSNELYRPLFTLEGRASDFSDDPQIYERLAMLTR